MGTMTTLRRHIGPQPVPLPVESMGRSDLVIAALTRCPDIETVLDAYDVDDDETVSRIGWLLASRTGTDFRIGRRILQILSPDGYLLPLKEFRLSRVTEPTEQEMLQAPTVTPWRVELWQSGSTPAEWRVNGTVYHRDWEPRIWSRLLYLNHPWAMALTDDGWVRLGRRI